MPHTHFHFNFGYIDDLKKLMAVPVHNIKVVIVDDRVDDVKVIENILNNWPNIKLITFIQKGGKIPNIPLNTDIVLLDYYLDGVTGDYIARDLREKDFEGVVSSISTSIKPSWAYRHFPFKREMFGNDEYMQGFVHCMNELIHRSEEIRKWK